MILIDNKYCVFVIYVLICYEISSDMIWFHLKQLSYRLPTCVYLMLCLIIVCFIACLRTQVIGFAHDERTRLGRKVEYADVYHSANRYAVGSTMVPIVLPRSTLWSFGRGRLVLGREAMALQGHTLSSEMFESLEVTESQLQDLAGNSLPDWLVGGGRWYVDIDAMWHRPCCQY